ncbi:hypothetical protein B0H67DRAFT_572843, partial [Lasiosphaeris hirsuta]
MSGIVQIPFNAFKLIDLGQSFGLSTYQSLYKDHSEPVGLVSVIQALGLLRPSDEIIESFNNRWTKESARWKLQETSIEVVTGKSSTTGEMAKTGDGEAALLALSFLIETVGTKTASELVRKIIDATPSDLLPIRPRRGQIANVITAVGTQTACVSWHQEISNAQECVCERPIVWAGDNRLPSASFDLPVEALRALYHAFSVISRFPSDYHCTLRTPLSLTLPFALANSICGFRVCVIVDGEVVHGSPTPGAWRVKMERIQSGNTEIKLGHKLEDAQDLLIIDEVGPLRANRIPIRGIGQAASIGQGLSIPEGEEVAALAIGAAISAMGRWTREVVDESGDDNASDVSFSHSQPSTSQSQIEGDEVGSQDNKAQLVPIKTRISIKAITEWWGCPTKTAIDMLKASEKAFANQQEDSTWMQLRFSRATLGKMAEFEDLGAEQKAAKRTQTNHALDRRDYARLVYMLATQLILIAFLQHSPSTAEKLRVRSTCQPQNSELGRAIRTLSKVEPLRQSDVLYSWYFWLCGKPPKRPESDYGLEVITTDGYMIYRSLLLDLNLSPESCETVTIEPGHICSGGQRLAEVRGPDQGHLVFQEPHHREVLEGPGAKLRPQDRTGPLQLSWTVEEGDHSVDLEMHLKSRTSGLALSASIYQVSKLSWGLQYGDRLLGCTHDEERVGSLMAGEQVEIVSAGALERKTSWGPLLILSANDNDLGQIASLLSAPENSRGMVRRDACLRCCVTACNKTGLDFLI